MGDELLTVLAAGGVNLVLTAIGFPLAILVALATASIRIAAVPVISQILTVYVDFVRMTPLILHLFFVFYALPIVGIRLDSWTAAILTMSLHYGAYLSEAFRAAYQSVPRGFTEASEVLGMRTLVRLRRMTVPLSVRVAIPPTANTLIDFFRGTSVVAIVAVPDIVYTALSVIQRNPGSSPLVFALVAAFFVAIVVPATALIKRFERKWAWK